MCTAELNLVKKKKKRNAVVAEVQSHTPGVVWHWWEKGTANIIIRYYMHRNTQKYGIYVIAVSKQRKAL